MRLEVCGLSKAFGAHRVLLSIGFALHEGEIVGLLGPNGSGKSTLLNIMSGFLPPDGGSITLNGELATGRSADALARAGLVRTFQLPSMPARMTVRECVLSGTWGLGDDVVARHAKQRHAEDLLEDLALADVQHQAANAISGGQKKLLSIAMALGRHPTLLCLDEPTAGIHPVLRARLVKVLRRQHSLGTDILVIEHDMHFVRELCTRCLVLDQGMLIADCAPSVLADNPLVVDAYLGRPREKATT